MPRRARITLPNVAHHIIQRGNNRQACFFCEQDYLFYLQWLEEYSKEYGCSVHAYILMTNHVHLLITPNSSNAIGQLMKRLGQRYVQYINRTYKRSGTLWEGRFKSCITQDEFYVLSCYRYIELNPVRAQMVKLPQDYKWSSYHTNGLGNPSVLISPHPSYLSLASNVSERLLSYQQLFEHAMEQSVVSDIRKTTQGNFVLGNEKFKKEIEVALNRRVTPKKAGRPKKVN